MILLEKFRENQKYVAWGFFIVGFTFWIAYLMINFKDINHPYPETTIQLVVLFLTMIICGLMIECNRCKYLLLTKQSF